MQQWQRLATYAHRAEAEWAAGTLGAGCRGCMEAGAAQWRTKKILTDRLHLTERGILRAPPPPSISNARPVYAVHPVLYIVPTF